MSIEAELGQYILLTHNSKQFRRFSGGVGGLNPLYKPVNSIMSVVLLRSCFLLFHLIIKVKKIFVQRSRPLRVHYNQLMHSRLHCGQ